MSNTEKPKLEGAVKIVDLVEGVATVYMALTKEGLVEAFVDYFHYRPHVSADAKFAKCKEFPCVVMFFNTHGSDAIDMDEVTVLDAGNFLINYGSVTGKIALENNPPGLGDLLNGWANNRAIRTMRDKEHGV